MCGGRIVLRVVIQDRVEEPIVSDACGSQNAAAGSGMKDRPQGDKKRQPRMRGYRSPLPEATTEGPSDSEGGRRRRGGGPTPPTAIGAGAPMAAGRAVGR